MKETNKFNLKNMSHEVEEHEVSSRVYTLLLVVVVGLSLFFAAQILVKWRDFNGDFPRTVSVDAVGKAYVTPDIATFTVGVQTDGKEVNKAVADNTKKVNDIIAVLKEKGVDEKDIQTINYSVYPRYNWTEAEGQNLEGYSVNQEVQVKIRDFEKIGDVVAASTAKGANIINSLQFTVDDPEKYKSVARADAIAKIKEKTASMENQTGLNLGKVVSIYEYEDYSYAQPMYYKAEGMGGAAEAAAPAPDIQPGQSEIRLRVTMEYKVR